jgi:hypothetical protein
MLVTTNTSLNNNSSTNSFTDSFTNNKDFKLLVLDNLIVCKSA